MTKNVKIDFILPAFRNIQLLAMNRVSPGQMPDRQIQYAVYLYSKIRLKSSMVF